MLLQIILERLRQGHNTMKYPQGPATPPALFAGRPELAGGLCGGCDRPCLAACPTGALGVTDAGPALDTGRCLFCRRCEAACSRQAVRFTADHRLAATRRTELVVTPGSQAPAIDHPQAKREFRRSFALRVVSAGGCGACEADANVLTTLAWDMGRFGIRYVASPRHADGVLVTGPVTAAMAAALRETYDAVPEPKVVIAVGACAISGGLFAPGAGVNAAGPGAGGDATGAGGEETAARETPPANSGVAALLPVDLFVPGCPPHPFTLFDALLRFIGAVG